MLARAAEWNCSVFRKEGPLPMEDVIKSYLKYAVDCDNSPSNTKYCVQNILRELQESPLGRRFLDSQTLEQIWWIFLLIRLIYSFFSSYLWVLAKVFVFFSEIWGLGDYCRSKSKEFRNNGLLDRFHVSPIILDPTNSCSDSRKRKIDEENDVSLMRCAFLRNSYTSDLDLPKTRLLKWTKENRKKMPVYNTRQEDKLFCSVVTVDGKKYGSSFW